MPVSSQEFKQAMAKLPSAVTIVTTVDDQGRRSGFTASAVCSLSLAPPLILVCLNRGMHSYPAFVASDRFLVNVLRPDHVELGLHFGRPSPDKFAGGELAAGELGLPALPDAAARIACHTHSVYHVGDHSILVGQVERTSIGDGDPVVHHERRFRALQQAELTPAG